MSTKAVRYQAHCIWCGRDADADAREKGRCPRCGSTLLFEVDLDPPSRMARERAGTEMYVRERRPHRRRTATI